MKDIRPRNSKKQLHGYTELYNHEDKLFLRVVHKNGISVGYKEYHIKNPFTLFFIR